MIASEIEDAVTGQEVEVLRALGVPKVRSFSTNVAAIEPDGFERPAIGRIDVRGMEIVDTGSFTAALSGRYPPS